MHENGNVPTTKTPTELLPAITSGGVTGLARLITRMAVIDHRARGPIAEAADMIVEAIGSGEKFTDDHHRESAFLAKDSAQEIRRLATVTTTGDPWEPVRDAILNHSTIIVVRAAEWY